MNWAAAEPSSKVDMAVAKLVVPEICDGACLQLGIGSMPNAIGKMIAESDLKDLGVHTEMYVDAFVDMSIAGRITGLRKPFDRGRQTYAFAAGTQKLYDFIDNNPECMAAPVSYVNDIARCLRSTTSSPSTAPWISTCTARCPLSPLEFTISPVPAASGTSSWARTCPRVARASSAAPPPTWTKKAAS